MTGELLLELLTEEIPARMQRRAIEDLKKHLDEWLQAHRLRATAITGYVTPRRMVVIADGIPARQPDDNEEKRGPRIGSPDQAIAGFLRSVGLASIDQCEVRDDRYFAVIGRPGRAAADVLPDVVYSTMTSVTWPKSMRYPALPLRWVRPINSVICLYDGAVLNLPLGDVPVGRVTRGHRFLAPGAIEVANAADYRDKLAKAHVVLDWSERRAIIAKGLDELAKAEGVTVKPDEGLLDEVTGLVEYPVVLMGRIDADFVRPLPEGLPPEVLATAMRTHQKYFSCLNEDGTPAPRFLFVANNATPDNRKTIAAGNERVLRARLSDARFFWDQDRKVRLEDRVESLKQRVYHEKLGSVYDKALRVENIAHRLAPELGADPVLSVRAVRAAHLAKADLSTAMVGEFPELQGVMGRYYALYGDEKEPQQIADAIAEHYKPLGPNDTVPTAPESIALALADKIDTLVCFFAIGQKPSGSGDPYALRRAAIGIFRIILKNNLRLPLRPFLDEAWQKSGVWRGDSSREVLEFIAERLKVHLREEGIRHDVVAAAFAQRDTVEDNLVRLIERVNALQSFLASSDGASLLIAYRRASNIVTIEERKDDRRYDGTVNASLLVLPEEQALNLQLSDSGRRVAARLLNERFEDAMASLATLRQPIDEFFERVTVNVPDKELRKNRLRLLARIRATMNQVADFSQIEG